jgi:glutamate synthase (NADPH/NADH) large chain
LIEKHVLYTDSNRGKELLSDWDKSLSNFVRVMPTEYKKALARLAKGEVMVEELEIV